jgi:hypothetical protein
LPEAYYSISINYRINSILKNVKFAAHKMSETIGFYHIIDLSISRIGIWLFSI